MAESWWDVRVTEDYSDGALTGFILGLHRGDQQVNTYSPLVSVGQFAAFVGACRSGNDADVAVIAPVVFGPWWSAEITARSIASVVRSDVKAWSLAPRI